MSLGDICFRGKMFFVRVAFKNFFFACGCGLQAGWYGHHSFHQFGGKKRQSYLARFRKKFSSILGKKTTKIFTLSRRPQPRSHRDLDLRDGGLPHLRVADLRPALKTCLKIDDLSFKMSTCLKNDGLF
jgi:hypothetical protein